MLDKDKALTFMRQEENLLNMVSHEAYDLTIQAIDQAKRDLALKHEREIAEYARHLLEEEVNKNG